MSSVSPRIRYIAEQLIAAESRDGDLSGTLSAATFSACETLRPHLATFMGTMGARALLARALALASAEVQWLRALHVGAEGSVGEPDPGDAAISPRDIVEGRVAVLSHLLDLMVAFIGEALTLQLALEAWPRLSLKDLHRGDANEKTKSRR